jgi:hypothetical protein
MVIGGHFAGRGRSGEARVTLRVPLTSESLVSYNTRMNTLETSLEPWRAKLLAHPLYARIQSAAALRTFLETHVFCVWDFQCLLVALRRDLTGSTLPWQPTPDPEARRLINSIVLDEESDVTADGRALSHFEMYLEAMRDCGANLLPVTRFLQGLERGQPWRVALAESGATTAAQEFVAVTMGYCETGTTVEVAASFTYGREDVIPAMFTQLVASLAAENAQRWSAYHYYLERHIQHDGETHGPMSRALVARLCGADTTRWQQAEQASIRSLQARLKLWDALLTEL